METLLGQWICYHQTVTETNVMHICMAERGTQITNSKFTRPKTTNNNFNKQHKQLRQKILKQNKKIKKKQPHWRAWHRNLHRWLLAINWGYYES